MRSKKQKHELLPGRTKAQQIPAPEIASLNSPDPFCPITLSARASGVKRYGGTKFILILIVIL
ncbi:MAG TPA: hypothetical protein VMF08_21095 [Candidatus Sulfotelmatobacter sp.]|nr:hypothetical protein [Candidatus Sulfotelmatobacter sp.]